MILLKILLITFGLGVIVCNPAEKDENTEKSLKQEKVSENGADGSKNEKLKSSASVHNSVPIMFGYHPFPYFTNYMPHYFTYPSAAGFQGKQNSLASNKESVTSFGNSGFGYNWPGYGYGSLNYGHEGANGGYGKASHGYGGSSHEHVQHGQGSIYEQHAHGTASGFN